MLQGCRPQGRSPLTVAGLRPGYSYLPSVSSVSSVEGPPCTCPLLPAEGTGTVSGNLGGSRPPRRGSLVLEAPQWGGVG